MLSMATSSIVMINCMVAQKSPSETTNLYLHLPHFTTSTPQRSTSYSLAHSNIAAPCQIDSTSTPIPADWHMRPENDSFTSSQHCCLLWRGTWFHYYVEKEAEWGDGEGGIEKNNRELRKLSGQGRVSLLSDSRSESSSSWNSRSWQSREARSTRTMSRIINRQIWE